MMSQTDILKNIPLSVLDLVPVLEGESRKQAMENSLSLAQYVETLGYNRFWISEHHNTEGLVSSATIVLLTYLAQGTKTIRIGSGGIMLPNHTPLVVAEQFGSLATLYPDRIDLGLGRAPGTDQPTARALRRNYTESVNDFPNDVQELQYYFSALGTVGTVRAIPGEGTEVPLYLLGSSTFSARLAAELGLPYAFASHFAPDYLLEALRIYRENFKPSRQLGQPYTMAAVNVVMADTDEEAEYLSTSMKLFALGVIRNTRKPLQLPVEDIARCWSPEEAAYVDHMMHYSFIGNREKVDLLLSAFVQETCVDELIISSSVYDQKARLRSFKLLSETGR